MANLQRIIYLSATEYTTLITDGSITKNGRTIVYNDNDLYITPETGDDTIGVLSHKLTFGANGEYVFDGSEDVTVPVYGGVIT